MKFCRPGHEGSLVNVCFHPKNYFVCSTGCDGYLNVYKLIDIETGQVKTKRELSQKISKGTTTDGVQMLECDWHPDGKILGIPGSGVLNILNFEEPCSFQITIEPKITHQADITMVQWNKDDPRYLLTGCLGNKIKFWDFSRKQLIFYGARLCPIKKLRFCPGEDSTKAVMLFWDG